MLRSEGAVELSERLVISPAASETLLTQSRNRRSEAKRTSPRRPRVFLLGLHKFEQVSVEITEVD
jgi:hypothetical protein